jgi:hypothetical protein
MVAKRVGVPSLHGFLDFGAVFDVVRTEAFLADLEVVVAFLAENVVDEQSNMGAYFVSQCFVVICVGLLLVIALRILVVAFLVFMFRAKWLCSCQLPTFGLTMRLNLVE